MHTWPKPWSSMEDPVVPLERNLHGHRFAGLLWERQCKASSVGTRWKKFQIGLFGKVLVCVHGR